MTRSLTVYAWASDGESLTVEPRALPACRVWGDAILQLVAETQDPAPSPPVAIRSSALFAHTTPANPSWLDPHGQRRRHEVQVDPTTAAVASAALADDLVGAHAWRLLGEWLVDRGYTFDEVSEEITAIESPDEAIVVERGLTVVKSTRPGLLDDVLAYFGPAAAAYLQTWRPLDDMAPVDGSDEVIVPRYAVSAVERSEQAD